MASELFSALILAIIQGITEWLPISSSGHLVLFEALLDYNAGLVFEVALHFGTLMAVFVYFGQDIMDIIEDILKFKTKSDNFKAGMMLIVASIPAAIVGYSVRGLDIFHNLWVVSFGFGITGLFLFIASLDLGKKGKLRYGNSFLIGVSQALAIFPGISRSGTTISSGMLLGLDAKTAAKFSFLLSVPIIFGANLLVIGNNTLPPELIWATLVSFVVGLISIHFMFKYVLTDKKNLRWFGGYALLLALALVLFLLL
tara:strand:- start:324 stop:1091 length:768 start_codon:yes stop_codon:yes gene_type:complete